MQVHAFVDEGLGHSSYLIDLGNGTAAVIDPPRFPEDHEALARKLGLDIVWTIDTHSHADYVTGSPGLVVRRTATFVAPEASRLATPHRPVADGDCIALAPGITMLAIATPGHTPDHCAYLLEVDGRPEVLFSGGSLMVGTVGRTDLAGKETAEPLAHEMFRSLRRFDGLDDALEVLPTHGAGSFCSAPGASERTTTMGRERATNPLFAITDEASFVATLLAGFGAIPAQFGRLPELNRRGPRRFDTVPTLADLSPAAVESAVAIGAVIVDIRRIAKFAAGHVAGSLSNQLRPVFGTWLGWLVDPGQPIVFVADDDQDIADAVRQCLDVGHEQFAGRLAGGVGAWKASGRTLASISLVGAADLRSGIVDVRQSDEFARGHVLAAMNVELAATRDEQLPMRPMTVMCGHGERAMTGASVLAARGYDVDVLLGGPDDWASAAGQPLVAGP